MKKILIFGIVGAIMAGAAHAEDPMLPTHGPDVPQIHPTVSACRIVYNCGSSDYARPPVSSDEYGDFTVAENTCEKAGDTFAMWVVTSPDPLNVSAGMAMPGDTYNIDYCLSNNDYTPPYDSEADRLGTITFTARWASEVTSVMTSTTYVEAQVSGLQDNFAGLGADTLMTFGSQAGQVLSRDIVTTLGTPNASGNYTNTSDNSVPTTGAINSGIDNKQNLLNGTTGFAITGTGTDGVLDEKAIYSLQVGANSLIEAGTLNSAIVEAVNSEMTQINENGQPDENGTLWRINDSVTLLPTSSIDLMTLIGTVVGTGYTSNDYTGSNTEDYGMSNTVISNDPMAFAVDYGNNGMIKGHGRCSTLGVTTPWYNNNNTFASDHFVENLTDETVPYTGGTNCYCHLDSYIPVSDSAQSLSASWVFGGNYPSATYCASGCPNRCARTLQEDNSNSLAFRTAVFGAAH